MNSSTTATSVQRLPAYSETMEDQAVIEQALQPRPGEVAVCVASGGDNAFALALHGVQRVLAVDIDPLQIALCRLKERAIAQLPWPQLAELAGVSPAQPERRGELLERLDDPGSAALRDLPLLREAVEREGLVGCGRLSAFVAPLRAALQALVGNEQLETLVTSADRAQREEIWREHLQTTAVIDLLAAALNESTIADSFVPAAAWSRMAEPRFHLHYHRVLRHLTLDLEPAGNFYLHRLWLGRFASPEVVPTYLSRAGHARLRAVLPTIEWHASDVLELLQSLPAGSIDLVNLSNVLDWSDDAHHDALWSALDRAARPGARVFLRSFLAERSPEASIARRWTCDPGRGGAMAAADRVGYFSRYELWQRRGAN
jgi:S-adenosylmethionine-diacylglycerol 3-amino-3-carboxypropyl transferase